MNRMRDLGWIVLSFILGMIIGITLTLVITEEGFRSVQVDNKTCGITPLIFPGDKHKIITAISSAKESIYVEMYGLTDSDIITELIRAKDRGVDVKVILEDDVDYNDDAFMTLAGAGVPVKWDGDRYRLTHTKLMIIDNQTIIIGSPNFTFSGMTKNREAGLITDCIVQPYLTMFVQDWNS